MASNRAGTLAGLGLVLVLLSACPPHSTGTPDGGAPDAGSNSCATDRDCPDPRYFFCNSTTFQCEPSCARREDCNAEHRGVFAIPECDTAPGCQCDEGRCVQALCSSDGECNEGLVCRDGACAPAPVASSITSCRLWPDYVVARAGAKVTFTLLAQGASGRPLVPESGVRWSASAGAQLGNSWAASAEVELPSATGGEAVVVQATAGGTTCAAVARVLGPPPQDSVRATVTDELTGRPISGATVILTTDSSFGMPVAQDTTGEDGVAVLPLLLTAGAPAVTVSAFHPDYGYLSIADYDVSGATAASRDLSLPLRRNPNDQYGGFQGTFQDAPATSNAHLGLAGLSVGGAVSDLTYDFALGATTPSSVHVGTVVNQDSLPLPAGTFLSVGDTPSKPAIAVRGLPGVCTAPAVGLPTAEASTRAGRCGLRSAWAFTADVPVTELPFDALSSPTGVNIPGLLGRSAPLFKSFSSFVVRDVSYTLRDAPLSSAGLPDTSDTSGFTPLDGTFAQPPNVPLAFGFVARVPALPRLGTGYADSVLVLGTAAVPGRGLVPLGLGAAVNANGDALTDTQAGLLAQGLVAMRMAPTHHGLEGANYGLMALALAAHGDSGAALGFAASGLYRRIPNGALPFDPDGAHPISVGGPFLAYPKGGAYNYVSTPTRGLQGRQFKFVTDPQLVGASVIRVVFTDAAGRSWTVLMDPSRLLAGVQVPPPPPGFADRTFATDSEDVRSTLLVQALRLDADPEQGTAPLGFNDLVELDAAQPDRLMERVQAFSSLDYGRPDVQWLTPAQDDQTLPAGQAPLVKVAGFKVGDDGGVRFTYDGCLAPPAIVTTDPSQGRGELPVPVPPGCSGNVVITAELYAGTPPSQPLAPRVVSSRRLVLP